VPYFKAPVFNTIPGAYEEPSCAIASHSDRRGPRRWRKPSVGRKLPGTSGPRRM